MATLKISSNSVSNPLTLDLSSYLDVQRDAGMDPLNPQFTQKVWGRSILKEGATLALEQLTEKELLFPLYLGPIGGLASAPVNTSSLKALEQQINQVINTPGFTVSWQPSGASQATVFDGLSGQLDIDYDFRREQQFWEHAKLRIFTQPLGRTAASRVYATASGVGPLLMISPYASGGALTAAASTQAGTAGYGVAVPGGVPSGGAFYWGSPSLAGDAPAQLQISYVGPLPNTATTTGVVPYTVVSLLPDQNYAPLLPVPELTNALTIVNAQTVVASQYMYLPRSGPSTQVNAFGFNFYPFPGLAKGSSVPLSWAGNHRLFAIARASGTPGAVNAYGTITALQSAMTPYQTSASIIPNFDWGLYDLGVISPRPSEAAQNLWININGQAGSGSQIQTEVTAFVTLPENSTWFLAPSQIVASQYGVPMGSQGYTGGFYSNTLLLDDVLSDQFIYAGVSQTSAPSPIGMGASAQRITQFSRGLMPRPDPRNGLPIIAILGVGQTSAGSVAPLSLAYNSASWSNAQNLRTMAQVNVLERTRYTLG